MSNNNLIFFFSSIYNTPAKVLNIVFLIRSAFLIGPHNATTCTIEGFCTNKENKCYWYYFYNEDCAQSNSLMTLVSHEKLSDCYNLTCNEGNVSNWGEREKGRGIGASKLSSFFPFALSPSSPPSSSLLLSPPPPFASVTRYLKGQYFLLLQCHTFLLLIFVLLVTAQVKTGK